jgi:hypothetical protein
MSRLGREAVDESDEIQSTVREDMATETAILAHLLALHPCRVTFEELLGEIAEDPADFAQRDGVERAVRDLVAAGLVHRGDGFVLPSRAALRFEELLE